LVLAAAGKPPDRAILVAMVTSNAARVRKPAAGDVVLADWQNYGLKLPSVVRTRRLWTAEERDFTSTVLGSVSGAVLSQVRQAVHDLVGKP
jgi:hypothetical protein